ncbi:MAG: oligosaccharide flippase family protein, partial [Planctomycetia bacterium]|nr:oligosaccharide flippase family protein [Planctomycetia bacterium]
SHYKLALNIAALLMNAALNYLLIPLLGIIGAALATAMSFLFLAVVGMGLSQKLYYVPYRWWNIVFSGVLAVAVSNAVTLVNVPFTWEIIVAKVGMVAIVVWVLARLLSIRWDERLVGWITNRNGRASG